MDNSLMKAAVLTGPRQVCIKELPVPQAGSGEIEIRVSACGVCGSDIHLWKAGKGWAKGDMPNFIMGHEFCGVVTNPNGSRFMAGEGYFLGESLLRRVRYVSCWA